MVTGPTVVGPLVRNLRLRPRLQTVLEAEGVFVDPIGAVLAVLTLEVILAADRAAATAGILDFTVRVVLGLAFGLAAGFGLALLLRLTKLVRGLENTLVVAMATLLFHVGELEGCRGIAPMARSVTPRLGDRAIVALCVRAREEAVAELASLGWQVLSAPATETASVTVPA